MKNEIGNNSDRSGEVFGQGKSNYAQFRPTYPDRLYQTIFQNINCSRKSALDIGVGTGISTAYLALEFDEVDAIEPDKRMTDCVDFASNVTIHSVPAEDFQYPSNHYQLVTAGNSFYWTDGEVVASSVHQSLVDSGIFAVYRYSFPTIHDDDLMRIIQQELDEHWNEYRSDRLIDEDYSIRAISAVNLFGTVDCTMIENIVLMTIDEIIGFFLSTSYCLQYVHDNTTLSIYEDYLRELMIICDSTIKYPVDFSLELIIATKRNVK